MCCGWNHKHFKSAFIRDVCFLLLVLVFLLIILIQEEIDLWSAIGFSSMYVVYVIAQECKCFLVLEDQRAQAFLFYSYFL